MNHTPRLAHMLAALLVCAGAAPRELRAQTPLEKAEALFAAENYGEAARLLVPLAGEGAENERVYELLGYVLVRQRKPDEARRLVLEPLAAKKGANFDYTRQYVAGGVAQLEARMAHENGDEAEAGRQTLLARDAFFEAYKLHPGPERRDMADTILRLDRSLGDSTLLREHARFILQNDPSHQLSAWTLANAHFKAAEYKAAEALLNPFIAADPESYVLNSYAETLRRLGKPEDAERAARAAVNALEGGQNTRALAAALDTLAMSLVDQGRFADAKIQNAKSIELAEAAGDNANIYHKFTRLLIADGLNEMVDALVLSAEVELRKNELDKDMRERFQTFRKNKRN